MFQPQLGTTPILGSVADVISYLSLYHRFNCFLDLPHHPPCPNSLPICHTLTELHRSLNPILPPLTFLILLFLEILKVPIEGKYEGRAQGPGKSHEGKFLVENFHYPL